MEIGKKIEALLGNRQGQRTDKQLVVNCAQVPGTKTRDIAAEKAGFGEARTYEYASRVVEQGAREFDLQEALHLAGKKRGEP